MTGLLGIVFAALLLAALALAVHRLAPQGTFLVLRLGLGAAAAVGTIWALIARQAAVALGLAGIAMALLRPLIGAWRAAPTPGRSSEIRGSRLAMSLDHDTGAMDGEVLAGRFAGRRLSDLSSDELNALLEECEGDEESLTLLTAWLERHGLGHGEAGAPSPDPAAMSEEDAYRILGLQAGATREEIRAAHRRLIRKVHPDLGGSPALAALLNAAKQRLDPGSTPPEDRP